MLLGLHNFHGRVLVKATVTDKPAYGPVPVFGEVWQQVLVRGLEELDQVCRPKDLDVTAQKFIAVFLQHLETQQ